MIRSIRVACVIASISASAGCKSLEDGALETFSQEFSCPTDRVVVTERKDIDVYEATFGPQGEPPAEIKDDAQRLALWKQQQQEQREAFSSDRMIFAVRGCDHDELYSCFHPGSPDGGGANYAEAACSKLSQPPKS